MQTGAGRGFNGRADGGATAAAESDAESQASIGAVAFPEPEMDIGDGDDYGAISMEADSDAAMDGTESVYAASGYPGVPIAYRVERFDAATIGSSSRSLYDEELDYVLENGRRYCGDYVYPNDELEQDRLRVLHQVFLHVFGFELTSVALDQPALILDIGTGTGEWAIGMGEAFPECEVVGVDISAIQPRAVPHNVFFEVDDCEMEWMRPENSVDLVHMRDLAGAFSDWDFVYREAWACLKPGRGRLEVLDFHDHVSPGGASFYSAFPADAQIHVFARALDEAAVRAGRRRGTHHLEPAVLHRAGFVDVQVREHVIPVKALRAFRGKAGGGGSRDEGDKDGSDGSDEDDTVGKLWLIVMLHSVEACALRLLTRYLGWDPVQVLALCEQVCQEIKSFALDPATATVLQVYLRVVTARKPLAEEEAERGPTAELEADIQNGETEDEEADIRNGETEDEEADIQNGETEDKVPSVLPVLSLSENGRLADLPES